MKTLAGLCMCIAVVVLAGCGGGDDSSSSKPRTTTGSVTHLGKANAAQRRRARRYTTCLGNRVKKRSLTFRKGTPTSPPVIIGTIRRTKFGINLGSRPADAKRLEQRLRKTGNSALYRRGSTVVAFAGSHPSSADITTLTGCADRIG